MVLWAQIAGACGQSPFVTPSSTVWSPPGCAAAENVCGLEIPILQLLNDMIASATHPDVFNWDLFLAVHDTTIAGYCMSEPFIRRSMSAPDDSKGRFATHRTRHLARDVCNFGNHYLLPLWTAAQESIARLRCTVLHVVVKLPEKQAPSLNLELSEYRERVTCFYPNTVDKPGELCLFTIPCKHLQLTRDAKPSAGQWRAPPTRPGQVHQSISLQCLIPLLHHLHIHLLLCLLLPFLLDHY